MYRGGQCFHYSVSENILRQRIQMCPNVILSKQWWQFGEIRTSVPEAATEREVCVEGWGPGCAQCLGLSLPQAVQLLGAGLPKEGHTQGNLLSLSEGAAVCLGSFIHSMTSLLRICWMNFTPRISLKEFQGIFLARVSIQRFKGTNVSASRRVYVTTGRNSDSKLHSVQDYSGLALLAACLYCRLKEHEQPLPIPRYLLQVGKLFSHLRMFLTLCVAGKMAGLQTERKRGCSKSDCFSPGFLEKKYF